MLKQLKVTNFRRLRDATIDFTPGLNVVRGQNEAGKSTMLEAITYAFFGVSACRTSLAEMVTWGEKDSTLKVTLAFEIEGIEYTITRGKSGAEVNWKGGKVTGQKEVAAWVGRAFGVSSQNVNRLILSGQGNIRGALSEGSTKTAELIEQLANFSVIDEVIELISTKLTTGATRPSRRRRRPSRSSWRRSSGRWCPLTPPLTRRGSRTCTRRSRWSRRRRKPSSKRWAPCPSAATTCALP
jgi:DNA repair exonuclease SbcCD ATPase subunit